PLFRTDLLSQSFSPRFLISPRCQRQIAISALGVAKHDNTLGSIRHKNVAGQKIAKLRKAIPRNLSSLRQPDQRLIQLLVIIAKLMGLARDTDQIRPQINIIVKLIGPANPEN